jgi:hypothetical protein
MHLLFSILHRQKRSIGCAFSPKRILIKSLARLLEPIILEKEQMKIEKDLHAEHT